MHWAHQFKCDGGHDGNEEAIAQAQEEADDDEAPEAPAQGDHHGHQAQEQEGDDLEEQGLELVMLCFSVKTTWQIAPPFLGSHSYHSQNGAVGCQQRGQLGYTAPSESYIEGFKVFKSAPI